MHWFVELSCTAAVARLGKDHRRKALINLVSTFECVHCKLTLVNNHTIIMKEN